MRDVLRDATLSIAEGERVGLVGKNGSGKTTLARILSGAEQADAGEVVRRNELRMSYLDQSPRFVGPDNAVDVVLAGLQAWQAAVTRHTEASARLEAGGGDVDALLHQQSDAAAAVEALGGWHKQHEAEGILGRVGVVDLVTPVEQMSGGEQRRVALARILVAAPDLAILDEPTNHLDVDAVQWLEDWLSDRFTGALVLITHDRYLLDRVVTRTLELDDGCVFSYDGGWARYLEAKAERMSHAERTDANRRNYLRRELEWLRRSPSARRTKQKARIDRVTAVAEQTTKKAERASQIEIAGARSGSTILEAESIAVDIAGRRLVEDFTLRLSEGERIGIVGPNGCGKTSLLRVLTGEVPPSEGSVKHGKHTRIAYLDQQRTGLDEDATVFESVDAGRGHVELGGQALEVRVYLERFLFSSHDQRQKISTLSGGERARVALARLLREAANVVVLDEPTNDLDVLTLAALEEALLEYRGTLLVVTHDRWFLDRIATSILAFEDRRVTQYQGGYTDFAAKRVRATRAVEPEKAKAAVRAPKVKRGLTYAERIELDGLLERVDEAEQKLAQLEAELVTPEFYAKPEADRRAFLERLEVARAEATRLADRWTELEAKAE
jgi:ATP-binding cassette subfamily F protein uup